MMMHDGRFGCRCDRCNVVRAAETCGRMMFLSGESRRAGGQDAGCIRDDRMRLRADSRQPLAGIQNHGVAGSKKLGGNEGIDASVQAWRSNEAVQHYPPVGPNRSVLTRPGSWPSVTNMEATDSTSWVGPQT